MRDLAFLFVFMATAASAPLWPTTAQGLPAPQSPTENCLALAEDNLEAQRDCIGYSATWCIENVPGGETTIGMVQCADAERMQWESLRGATTANLRATETPSQVALLEAAVAEQARWTQARCAYEASIYEGGSLARVVAAQCFRNAVAEHAIYLRNRHSEN